MKYLIFIILFFFTNNIFSQSVENTKQVIKELTSEKYFGRGYLKNGVNKAADYLANKYKSIGLKSFDKKSYLQKYKIELQNTFPNKQYLAVDGKELNLGIDYIINFQSGTNRIKTNKIIYYSDTAIYNKNFYEILNKKDIYKDYVLIIDTTSTEEDKTKRIYKEDLVYNFFNYKIFLNSKDEEFLVRVTNPNYIKNKKQYKPKGVELEVNEKCFPKKAKEIEINIKSKLEKKYSCNNVVGYIEGEIKDTFYVLSAHYDHVGGQGNFFYVPGAQDNASGTAFVLDFADYYSKNKPKYSIAFMLFSGEEAGLLGSTYYVEHPLFDLKKIKLLINLDMVGTGDEGFTIVNGKDENYKVIKDNIFEIASKSHSFDTAKINLREASCNSDHCPFNKYDIPAIFIYTMGGKTYYHNPKDKLETLTFTAYLDLFNIITELFKN